MKKTFTVLLAALMLFSLCFEQFSFIARGDGKSSFRKGDINGDGLINVTDYIITRLYILGLTGLTDSGKEAADVDGNGTVGVTDYILIRLHILGIKIIPANVTAHRVDALYTGTADKNLSTVNALAGSSYTYSELPDSEYPDHGFSKLTDGVVSRSFDKESWVGLNNRNNPAITFDLGRVVSGLSDLRVFSLRHLTYGIGLSSKMDLHISVDGNEYSYVGTACAAADCPVDEGFSYELLLPATLSARYVRLSFTKSESAWLFISEVEFLRYTTAETSYYGAFEPREITSPVYWDETEPDYAVSKNLIRGLPYQIKPLRDIAADFQTEYYNTPVSLNRLTDGIKAKAADYGDPAYFHFTQSEGRFVLFDLGAASAVTSFQGEFLKQDSTGIAPPTKISVYVSEDGVTFGKAGETAPSSPSNDKIVSVSFNFDKKYKARYVIVYFRVNAHVWCGELEIFGTKKIPSDAVSAKAIDYVYDAGGDPLIFDGKDRYLMPEDFQGVENVLLSYHCLRNSGNTHNESGLITVNEYLPHVGYYGADGVLKDTFMDGFLYLPYTAFNYSDYAKTLEGWKFYINNLFYPDRNVNALDRAVTSVKTTLSKPDHRVSIFFSILYTFPTLGNGKNHFGDIDGDGINEDFNTLQGRKKAIKWIIDEQISRFESGNYTNLDLKGFYWFEESAGSDPQDAALIRYASDYLHSMGYVLFWIPWYRAAGFEKWDEYGFDAACMQPNYAFSDGVDIRRLYDNAAYAKALGMCVEFESNGTGYAAVKKIKEYLLAGVETGYMHAVKMYYQGGVPGDIYNACKSTDPYVRSAYDEIYLYSKGTLTASDFYENRETAPPRLAESRYATGTFSGKVDADTVLPYKIKIETSPKYGTLRLNYDGSFVYTPFPGFAGRDSFTVYAEYVFQYGGSLTVEVYIE